MLAGLGQPGPNDMEILAFIIAVYTVAMLLIHFSTARILKAWSGAGSGWIKTQFPPRRALRVEALYWLLSLSAWPVWRTAAWKALVVVFAVIHIGVWLGGEFGGLQLHSEGGGDPMHAGRFDRAIITFDLVEAAVLLAMGTLTVLYLLRTA